MKHALRFVASMRWRRRKPRKPRLTLESLASFRRRRFWWRAAAVVACLLVLVALDQAGVLWARGGDVARYDGRSFLVAEVVDGDTLDVWIPDGGSPTTRIRVWGIDTPELAREAHGDEPARPAEPFADAAHALSTQLLAGQTVTLRLEPHRLRGRFGRLVAHVELADGGLVADRLLVAGLAVADDRWPHGHAERFALLERQARRDGAGVWSGAADAGRPPARKAPSQSARAAPR